MNGSILSESLAAMTGVIDPRRPTDLVIRGAQSYPDRIRRRLASFLAADEPAPIKWVRPPDQLDLWKSLNKQVDAEEMAELIDGVPDDMALGFSLVVQSARDYIKSKWPIFPNESLGLQNAELAPDEYGDVWQFARTIDDPQTIFDDLDSLTLLPEQVDAFAEVYPDLYEETVNLGLLLLQPFVQVEGMAKKKKVLPFAREEAIRTLLRLPIDAPIPLPQQEQPQQPKRPDSKGQERRTTIQSERVADKTET